MTTVCMNSSLAMNSTPMEGSNRQFEKFDFVVSLLCVFRYFHDGTDPRWTAIDKDDYTNYALQYYNAKVNSELAIYCLHANTLTVLLRF
jgi:hypothetical protein